MCRATSHALEEAASANGNATKTTAETKLAQLKEVKAVL